MTRETARDLHLLAALLVLVGCCAGCVPEPEPEYCYRLGYDPEAWYCEGRAQFPADTVPDSEKGDHLPPVVLAPCTTDSECADAYPGTNGDPIPARPCDARTTPDLAACLAREARMDADRLTATDGED